MVIWTFLQDFEQMKEQWDNVFRGVIHSLVSVILVVQNSTAWVDKLIKKGPAEGLRRYYKILPLLNYESFHRQIITLSIKFCDDFILSQLMCKQ